MAQKSFHRVHRSLRSGEYMQDMQSHCTGSGTGPIQRAVDRSARCFEVTNLDTGVDRMGQTDPGKPRSKA